MDKESIYQLQKIDCNCNDCGFMVRDAEKFKASQGLHHKWQLGYFNVCKKKVVEKAIKYKDAFYDLEMWDSLLSEAERMKFQFNGKTAMMNYGNCSKLNKPVSFIPNTCQIETQTCFKHRKELN